MPLVLPVMGVDEASLKLSPSIWDWHWQTDLCHLQKYWITPDVGCLALTLFCPRVTVMKYYPCIPRQSNQNSHEIIPLYVLINFSETIHLYQKHEQTLSQDNKLCFPAKIIFFQPCVLEILSCKVESIRIWTKPSMLSLNLLMSTIRISVVP